MSYCTQDNFQVAPGVYTHDYSKEEVEAAQGCCQKFVCGIPCPAAFNTAGVALGFGLPVVLMSFSWVLMGFLIALVYLKRDDYKGFFVCHRTLPLYIVIFALLGQGLDTSSSLGNAVNSYKFAFWDGAVAPIGVGMSLLLNGLLLAAPLNRMGLLTLPDLFRRKYGTLMEVMVSCIEIASFTVLLAGNLVGISLVLQFCFGLPKGPGVVISSIVLALYTGCGGLYSVALTDIPQALGGLSGLLVTSVYMMVTEKGELVPPASKGFAVDLGGNVTARTPGYTGPADCLDPVDHRTRTCDNYAYPAGDKAVFGNGMTDPDAYAPFPNAIVYNWCSIFVLGFGNLCALDFQARSIAAKCPRTARTANFVAGFLLLAVALPFGVLGGLARKYYGPDSRYATYDPDTCSAPLGLPSCAQWLPQENMAVFMLLWEQVPRALGAWAMIAMVAASVSTADGAILATATVAAHNLWRKVPRIGSNERNLVLVSRLFILPMTLLAAMTAMLAYRTSYLLVVSFDIVFAGVLVPLLAAVYAPNVSPNAGILSCLAGSLLRITLEQALPKDGSLVAPVGRYALAYGRALPGLPAFLRVDPPELTEAAGVWDPGDATCEQEPLADWTGLDSLLSPLFSLMVMVGVSLMEWRWPGLDVLWFVPKTWRQSSPLYATEDSSSHGQWGLAGKHSTALSSRPGSRVTRRHNTMPSVPEEDGEVYDMYDSDGGGGGTEHGGRGRGGGAAAMAAATGAAAVAVTVTGPESFSRAASGSGPSGTSVGVSGGFRRAMTTTLFSTDCGTDGGTGDGDGDGGGGLRHGRILETLEVASGAAVAARKCTSGNGGLGPGQSASVLAASRAGGLLGSLVQPTVAGAAGGTARAAFGAPSAALLAAPAAGASAEAGALRGGGRLQQSTRLPPAKPLPLSRRTL